MTVKKLPKYFNVTGLCVPGKLYMVDTSAKIDMIVSNYIERGEYFTINRSRQFGKTTTLNLLAQSNNLWGSNELVVTQKGNLMNPKGRECSKDEAKQLQMVLRLMKLLI